MLVKLYPDAYIITCLSKSLAKISENMVIKQKKGMYQPNLSRLYFGQQRLPTCWHTLPPASVFFRFTVVTLQYSVSCFVNLIIIFEKLVKYLTMY